ncbi:MAG: hypothetical protein J6S67_25355 [Methanobrevibacter sp.]|nr:hypothetical protein [Methanobrevibacter sp.]
MITRASAIYGMGDALNGRAFLMTYCQKKNINPCTISVYTEKYWWMFDGLGFKRGLNKNNFLGLTPFRNFGRFDLNKFFKPDKLDLCIAMNAGIEFSFDVCVPLPRYTIPDIKLPKRFITFNTGYGELSGNPDNTKGVCLKSWPAQYWKEFVKKIGVPCVQIGAGKSCEIITGSKLNLVNQLTIQESAEVMRRALFHVDMEGGLPILNQHLGKKSVVLFGPTSIEQQGRSFNLNIRSNTCTPCYEWGSYKYHKLYEDRDKLSCKVECMYDLKPDFVVQKIKNAKWI